MRLHVRIDERVAGFTALGIGRETRMPAVVVCTSGTAAANLLPAALEAHHAGVPLLLLTADRPPELRGVGANQTTRQLGMFTPSTRLEADLPVPESTDPDGDGEQSLMLRQVAADAVAAALGEGTRAPGPVHLNVPFREPLGGDLPTLARSADRRAHRGRRGRSRRRAGRGDDRGRGVRAPSIRAAGASARPTCPPSPTSFRTSWRAGRAPS